MTGPPPADPSRSGVPPLDAFAHFHPLPGSLADDADRADRQSGRGERMRPWLIQHTNTAGEHYLAVVVSSTRVAAAAQAEMALRAEGALWDGVTRVDALDTYADFPGVIVATRVA